MFHSIDEQTIIAQCTPRGSGAIALLRISGINALEIASSISKLPSNKPLCDVASHTIHYGAVIEPYGTVVDQVLFMVMQAPRTFTGQNTVEITCHNNQFIIEQIIALAIANGARLAQEGEFTKRAVLNGKIDLVQAEAINELIHAQTQMALKQSLAQLHGSLSSWLISIEQELLKALALSEASFEFLDEEMEFAPQINAMIAHVMSTITEIKKTYNQQQQIRQGIRVALIGSVNAGKSSLFNALLNQNRAIVTAIAGTTRDAIEAGVYKNGNYWTLVDTAGLRQTDDMIEQEGIRRSFEEAHKADIIILAYDSSREITAEENMVYQEIAEKYPNKIITVYTKVDNALNTFLDSSSKISESLETNGKKSAQKNYSHSATDKQKSHISPFVSSEHLCESRNAVPVSSKTKVNIDILEHAIEQKITTLFADIESPFLLNQRQYNLLLTLESKLAEIKTMLENPVAYELLSIHLNDAIADLAQLSGKAISEAGMDKVFREFCIGK